LTKGWRLSKAQQSIADRLRPCDIAVFHGTSDPKKMNMIEKWMIKNVKAPFGDFRNWDAIDTWAKAISDALLRDTP
jgi:hypothetical protein